MTEPQDVLAEALHDAIIGCDWNDAAIPKRRFCEDDFACHHEHLSRLAARGYALVRTPETLDVDGLLAELSESPLPGARYAYEVVKRRLQSPTPPEGLRAAVALIAADWFDTGYENGRLDHGVLADRLFAALAASPAPDPGAGLREALVRIEHLTRPYPLAETGWPQRYPPIAATEEAHAVAVAALAPSAEPPETP